MNEIIEGINAVLSDTLWLSSRKVLEKVRERAVQLQAQADLKDKEIAGLKELLRYPYEMPMHEAGNYDENCKWKDEVEQALKE